MNKFQLKCYYCGYSWGVNYSPKEQVFCAKCNDKNVMIFNNSSKIDYYAESPPFEDGGPENGNV